MPIPAQQHRARDARRVHFAQQFIHARKILHRPPVSARACNSVAQWLARGARLTRRVARDLGRVEVHVRVDDHGQRAVSLTRCAAPPPAAAARHAGSRPARVEITMAITTVITRSLVAVCAGVPQTDKTAAAFPAGPADAPAPARGRCGMARMPKPSATPTAVPAAPITKACAQTRRPAAAGLRAPRAGQSHASCAPRR